MMDEITKKNILEQHSNYKNKTMDELISERATKQKKEQNSLRKKWLPEKYNPNLEKD